MTLCLALICRQNDAEIDPSAVVIVSDQMITEGGTDEQYEAAQLKAIHLGPRITAFLAGDLTQGQEVCRSALPYLHFEQVQNVERAAKQLAEHVSIVIRARFNQRLRRYNTTIEALLDGSAPLNPRTSQRLLREFHEASVDAHFLIVGADSTGAHIWIVDGVGKDHCQDGWSFAAIGSGDRFARQTLKRVGYQWSWMLGEALAVGFMAKRDAEMDAWVGHEKTSFVVITREWSTEATTEEKEKLNALYETYADAVGFAVRRAKSDGHAVASTISARQLARLRGVELAPQSRPESTHGP